MTGEPKNALERYEKLIEERREQMFLAIGKAHSAFSRLESCLWELYSKAAQHHNSGVSNVVFYSPTNIETRIGIVDSVMQFLFDQHNDGQRLYDAWAKLKGKIDKKKNVRNQIAHGELLPSTRGDNTQVRLTPQVADLVRIIPHVDTTQHPGMTLNDVIQFTTAVHSLSTHVVILGKLTTAILEVRDGRFSRTDSRLDELWDDWKKQNLRATS